MAQVSAQASGGRSRGASFDGKGGERPLSWNISYIIDSDCKGLMTMTIVVVISLSYDYCFIFASGLRVITDSLGVYRVIGGLSGDHWG